MKNKSKTIGMILGTLHLSLVIFLVSSILSGIEPDWPMYWLLLIPFDLPILLLQYLTSWIIEPIFSMLASNFADSSPLSSSVNFWMPLFYFGLLGTVMWYFIPTVIIKVMNKLNKRT
jgi:hypothetical protein